MANASLTERVAALEKQVAELKGHIANGPARDEWRQTIGMFTEDPGMQDLFAAAMRLRETDRQKARRRFINAKRVKA